MSFPKVKHPDIGYLAITDSNGYGDVIVTDLHEIACTFLQQTGNQHNSNVEYVNTTAHAYLDIDDEYIKGLGYRIEGHLFRINPFGSSPENENWYKISSSPVGQRKLLNNAVNNVHVFLEKVDKPEGNYGS